MKKDNKPQKSLNYCGLWFRISGSKAGRDTVRVFLLAISLSFLIARPTYADNWADFKAAYARKNYAEAASILQLMANTGNSRAQYQLAILYEVGTGVVENYATANSLLLKAAQQKLPEAQEELANNLEFGRGGPPDLRQAIYWYVEAAEHGLPLAQYALGLHYSDGIGVPRNSLSALKWLILAVRSSKDPKLAGYSGKIAEYIGRLAGQEVDALEKQMTPDDIQIATRSADHWQLR
jgi:TPR repeat protein